MSVAYAVPAYVLLSTMLCLSYSCIECTKHKGKFDTSSQSMLSTWCIVSLIVASIIGAVSGEMLSGNSNTTHILLVSILAFVTLIISCSMVYWT